MHIRRFWRTIMKFLFKIFSAGYNCILLTMQASQRLPRRFLFVFTFCIIFTLVGLVYALNRSNSPKNSDSLRFQLSSADDSVSPLQKSPERNTNPHISDSSAPRPHIVFVLADDYGWNDIGYHGSEIRTPYLDKLSQDGVRLENYYVQPICTPSRAQLMSGRYQIHTGLQHQYINPAQPSALPLGSPTLADKLKESGYYTHAVGKWHLGFYKKEYLPNNRGFDSFYGILAGSGDHFAHTCQFHSGIYGSDLRNNYDVVKTENGHYSTELFTEKATDIIKSHDPTKPLFLYLSLQAVHTPLQVPDKYLAQYQSIKSPNRRLYAGMVAAMDDSVGNVTNALKARGMWDNTVFVFSTDNGGTPDHGASNWPLRGMKSTLWEGGIRGVGFVNSNLIKRKGTVSSELIHISDWFPTLVSLAGGSLNDTKSLDGFNQWDTISNAVPSPRKEILHNIDPLYPKTDITQTTYSTTFDTRVHAAIRIGDWKLLTGNPGRGNWISDEIIEEPPRNGNNIWLFNIAEDPYEKTNLAAKYPDKVSAMLRRLADYNATAVPVWFPNEDLRSDPRKLDGFWGPWL